MKINSSSEKRGVFKIVSITLAILFFMVVFSLTIEQNAKADDAGYWAQADRYGRYPCAGPADDCYVLPPIIIHPK